MNFNHLVLAFCVLFTVSMNAKADVNYKEFAGDYTFQSGDGSNFEYCEGVIRVQVDATKNEILLYQNQPNHGNGFITGYFDINKGPINDCCEPAEPTYHHDVLTEGEQLFVEETVHEYYKIFTVQDIDLSKSSLELSGKVLTLSEKTTDYLNPPRSTVRHCTFVKN